MAYTTATRAPGAQITRFAEMFGAFGSWLDQRRVYHSTLSELSQLDDRELNDLGLRRANLRAVAREAAGITG